MIVGVETKRGGLKPGAKLLGSLRVHTQYDDQPLKTAKSGDAELIGLPNKGSHALRRFMISAARSSGARRDVLEQITHNARGAIIDVYTAWEWPALCEAVSCLKVDPNRLPGRIYDICVSENANPRQSLRLFGGGGGNRTLSAAIR